jgi:hypothetical protein
MVDVHSARGHAGRKPLRARVLALQPLVGHARERTSWRELVQELGIPPTRDARR